MKKINLTLSAIIALSVLLSCNNSEKPTKVSENPVNVKTVAEDSVTKDARSMATLFCDEKRLLFELDSFTKRRDVVVDSFNKTPEKNISDDLRMAKKKWVDRIFYQNAQIEGLKTFKADTEKSLKNKYSSTEKWQLIQSKIDSLKKVICE